MRSDHMLTRVELICITHPGDTGSFEVVQGYEVVVTWDAIHRLQSQLSKPCK